jgi:hypothetical protein
MSNIWLLNLDSRNRLSQLGKASNIDPVRNTNRQVPLNSWGNIIIDPYTDEIIQMIIEIIGTFPRRMTPIAMTAIGEVINNDSLSLRRNRPPGTSRHL